MQGRISPPEDGRVQFFPRKNWQTEIELVPKVPLRGLEWLYDLHGQGANPLETAEGRLDARIRLGRASVRVASICADYFLSCPLVRIDAAVRIERIERLKWLISVCPEMGITRIVLPVLEEARIASSRDSEDILFALNEALGDAVRCGVGIYLEMDMPPAEVRAFLAEIRHPRVKINYDSGNSASLGYRVGDEFAAYGDRIGSLHIKDRILGGPSVPLGTGNVDFQALRSALLDIDYRGDFVMEIARGKPGDELNSIKRSAALAARWLRGEKFE
jgi:hexulose-6-phosphate isomerase